MSAPPWAPGKSQNGGLQCTSGYGKAYSEQETGLSPAMQRGVDASARMHAHMHVRTHAHTPNVRSKTCTNAHKQHTHTCQNTTQCKAHTMLTPEHSVHQRLTVLESTSPVILCGRHIIVLVFLSTMYIHQHSCFSCAGRESREVGHLLHACTHTPRRFLQVYTLYI